MKLIFTILTLCSLQPLSAQEPAPPEKLIAAYTQGRVDAIKQINQRYAQQADAALKLFVQSRDLDKANSVTEWSKRLGDTDDANDTDGIAPNPSSTDKLVALQTRYLKERAEAVTRVNKLYVGQVESSQRQFMQKGNLAAANSLSDLLAKIKSELGASTSDGDPLFSGDKQKKWKIKRGEWKWEGTKLLGAGNGSISYDISMQPPFVAQFKYTPQKGLRAGVLFSGVGLQNGAYSNKFGLPGVDDENLFPYVHGTTYRCALMVSRKQCELYVDGKLVCSSPGRDKKIESITVYSGDGWSLGSVEVQDLMLMRNTNKLPAP